MRPIGMRAQDSLRLEKGYGVWSLEFSTSCTPAMAGLERFVAADKGDFIGRDAFLAAQAAGPAMKLVLLQVESPEADATGYEPIHHDGKRIGYVTSGAYGHHVRQSLALAYVDTEWCERPTRCPSRSWANRGRPGSCARRPTIRRVRNCVADVARIRGGDA